MCLCVCVSAFQRDQELPISILSAIIIFIIIPCSCPLRHMSAGPLLVTVGGLSLGGALVLFLLVSYQDYGKAPAGAVVA